MTSFTTPVRGRGSDFGSFAQLGIVSALLTLYYLFVVNYVGFFQRVDYFVADFAPDSHEYLRLADWIYGSGEGLIIQTRSYFYPLVAGAVRAVGGNLGIWALQMVFWIAAGTILFSNVKYLCGGRGRLPWLMLVIYGACLTPIYLSILALTETLSLFLFALVSWLVLRAWDDRKPGPALFGLLGAAAVLAVTKPNYELIYMALTLIFLVAWWRGTLHVRFTTLMAAIALSATALLFQFALNYKAHGQLMFSDIGNTVLQASLLPQVRSEIEGRDFYEVFAEVKKENPSLLVMLGYFATHPWPTLSSFVMNLNTNVRLVLHLKDPRDPIEHWWRRKLNDVLKIIHIAMFGPMLFAVYLARRPRDRRDWRVLTLSSFFLLGFLPCGTTFWAADRWIAPFLVIWPVLYISVVINLREWWRLKHPETRPAVTLKVAPPVRWRPEPRPELRGDDQVL